MIIRSPRKVLQKIFVFTLIAGLGAWWWHRHAETNASGHSEGALSLFSLGSPSDRLVAEAADPKQRQQRRSSTAAEARLLSLLNLKKGEMAYLEITPEAAEQAFGFVGMEARPGSEFHLLANCRLTSENRAKLSGLVREGMPVTGNVDPSAVGTDQGPFSWEGDGWKASGFNLAGQKETTLQLRVEASGSEVLSTVTIPDGEGVIVFLPGGEKGLLIASGGSPNALPEN